MAVIPIVKKTYLFSLSMGSGVNSLTLVSTPILALGTELSDCGVPLCDPGVPLCIVTGELENMKK